MKQLFFTLVFSCFLYSASSQDFEFGPNYYAMLRKIPEMTDKEFNAAKDTLSNNSFLYGFNKLKQRYEFLAKNGMTIWKFVATPTGSGFGINKTEQGTVLFSKFYDDGGGEQAGGFTKDSSLVGVDARSLLCKYFEVMCK